MRRASLRATLVVALASSSSARGVAAPAETCAQAVVTPASGASLEAADPDTFELRLEWKAVAAVKTYRLEVGTEPDLAPGHRAFSTERPSTSAMARGLRPGHYYWRVSAVAGGYVGPVCDFTIAAAPFPARPSVLGAVASGRPLAHGNGSYCMSETMEGPGRPFGTFYVESTEVTGMPGDTLAVCVADQVPAGLSHRFAGDLGLKSMTGNTLRAGLVALPNGAGVLVAIVPASEGLLLACRTARRYEGVPVGKTCSAAGVTVSVPDVGKPVAVEIVYPDGRKERHDLPELVLR
jgi:hypothetical protein